MRNIGPKHGSALNTCNDFIRSIIRHVSGKITSGVAVRGDSGVAGEGRVDGIPKFLSWVKCTISLTNINSDWMSKLPLACVLFILYYVIHIILRGSFN